MPILDLNPRQEPLDANTAKFISISNLLAGIQDFAQGGDLDPNINLESAQKIFARGAQPSRTLTPVAKRMLRISWHTELAARILDNVLATSGIPDRDLLATLRRVSAQTLPVQVYYAIFNSSRCFTLVVGSPCSTHAQVHKDFGNRARGAPGPAAGRPCSSRG